MQIIMRKFKLVFRKFQKPRKMLTKTLSSSAKQHSKMTKFCVLQRN